MSRELTAREQVREIHDEFMIESASYKLDRLPSTLLHINALLDAYLDMWPELIEIEPGSQPDHIPS